jgi:hypothetical protein
VKVFEFAGHETDWVAANTEAEAREVLKLHYGIGDRDLDGSYESVSEVDPSSVVFDLDEVDAETEETITQTAADILSKLTGPDVIGSTCQ